MNDDQPYWWDRDWDYSDYTDGEDLVVPDEDRAVDFFSDEYTEQELLDELGLRQHDDYVITSGLVDCD